MDHNEYAMLVHRKHQLIERNKDIEKKQVELVQEFNRNKLEIEDIYVKIQNAKNTIEVWEGLQYE